jgi:hypothetical protein
MKRALALLPLALLAVLPTQLFAAPAELTARLTCQRAPGPGRILCEFSTQAHTGKLVWSDALVLHAPSFVRPLRSRLVAQLDPSGAASASAKLALIATEAGEGKLELLARAVVCREGPSGEWCDPEVLPVTALVTVGPAAAPAP